MQIKIVKKLLSIVCFCMGIQVFALHPVMAAGNPCRDIGVSGECELFKEFIQVQPMVAQQIIRTALNDNNVTFGDYTNKTIGDDTYDVTDSKGAKHTFYFDDLQDSKSLNVTTSVAGAICLLNGGIPAEKSFICNGRILESKLNKDLETFGMSAKCTDNMNATPYCKIIHNKRTGKLRGFVYKSQEIINPNTFKTMQIVSTDEVQKYLREYTKLSIVSYGLTMTGFQCLSMPQAYIAPDNIAATDDVLACTVSYFDPNTDKTYKQTIDFLFDDMYEHSKLTATAGRSGMICHAQGGSATSKGVCAGFTQDMCNKLQDDFDISTQWDPDAGGCVMTDVKKNAKIQKATSIAGSTGIFILGVVTLPVSGGTSGVAIAAAIGGVVTLISTATSGIVGAVIDHNFTTALLSANNCLIEQELCGGTTTRNNQLSVKNKSSQACITCATESVQNLIESVMSYNGQFTEDNANTAAFLVDVLYSVISGTLQPICIAEIATNVEQSPLVTVKETADYAMLLGVVLSLGSGIAGKFSKPQLTTVMDKIVGKVKGLQSSKLSTAALETLALSGRMERLAVRAKNASSTTYNALKNYKKARAWGKLTTKAADFVTHMDAEEIDNNGTNVYKTWTTYCGKSFPCDKTIDDFMSVETLNALCDIPQT